MKMKKKQVNIGEIFIMFMHFKNDGIIGEKGMKQVAQQYDNHKFSFSLLE